MFKSKVKEAIICFSNPRVTLPYPFAPHPPEDGFRGKLDIDPTKCVACGGCGNVCPARCIRFFDDGDKTRMEFILDRCTYCGRCADVCPEECITMTLQFETVTENREDLYIEQELYMGTCKRCGRCFEIDNALDKIPTRRMREGRKFVGASMSYGEPKSAG